MIKGTIPLFHVSNLTHAEAFYCGKLGFKTDFAHRADNPAVGYMGIYRDAVQIHLSTFSGDGVAGGVINLLVDNVDELHAEFVAKGVPIAVGPVNQTWGTREIYVKDSDNNCLRFMQQVLPL